MSKYIYAYTTSDKRKKWKRANGVTGDFAIKVGETTKNGIARIKEQLITAYPNLEGVQIFFHSEPALRPDGSEFGDAEVHKLLKANGVESAGGEWFEAEL